MANKKISQLTELTSANAATDLLPVIDTSASETKKIKLSNLPMSNSAIEQSYAYTTDFQSGTEQTRSLTTITNSSGYYGNSNLTSVYIGSHVTSIGSSSFFACTSLTSITISNKVTSIGNSAFNDCRTLPSINIPDSVTSLGQSVFASCAALASVTIGNSVTSIGNYAFKTCTSLVSITIPDSVTSIGNEAFKFSDNLATVNCLATSAPTLGSNAFSNTSLTQIHVPVGATGYGTTYGGLTVVFDL